MGVAVAVVTVGGREVHQRIALGEVLPPEHGARGGVDGAKSGCGANEKMLVDGGGFQEGAEAVPRPVDLAIFVFPEGVGDWDGCWVGWSGGVEGRVDGCSCSVASLGE